VAEMKRDLRYTFNRILCYFLALVMAGSIVLAVACGVASGMLRSESFVQSKFEKYNSQLLKEVDTAIEGVAESTGLPTKAYTASVQSGHIQTVLHQVSGNLVYGYKTDFSDSKYLYGYYRTGIINFCKENGIAITEEEIVRDACFAVDTFNQVCGDESTSFVLPFQQTYTRNPFYMIIFSIVAFIASSIILGFITYGRHKKYDYIGMGVLTGGVVLFALPTFAIMMKYSSLLHFSDVDVYNYGIADVINSILRIYSLIGIVITIIGAVILTINYSYYKRKSIKMKTEHDINVKLRKEFMQDHKLASDENEQAALENAIAEEAAEQAGNIPKIE
jgi:hypothetical protein